MAAPTTRPPTPAPTPAPTPPAAPRPSGRALRVLGALALTGAALLAALELASPAAADIIHMVNGGRIQGEIIDETEDTYRVRTKSGVQVIHKYDVDRVERLLDPKGEYQTRAKAIGSGTAAQWFELGEWAEERALPEEAAAAYRGAIYRDPDHEAARKKLGYRRYLGEWLTEAEVKAREGYVLWEGQWVRPEEKERFEQGYVLINGRWVHRSTVEKTGSAEEARAREAAEARRRAEAATAREAARPTPPAPGAPAAPTPARPRVVPVPPPAAGQPPSDEQVAAWVEAQKGRAREAEQALGITFEDVEEGPLLVHTTQEKDSERFRSFLRDLGRLYQAETKVYNIPFEAKIWPGKLQIYFFKDKSQFDAFATRVDGAGDAVASGGYFIEGEGSGYSKFHIAMYNLDVGTLAHELSHAFIARYDYSRKRVIPWANEGVAEFLRVYCAKELEVGGGDRGHWGIVKGMIERSDQRASLSHMMAKEDIAGTEGWAYAVSWSLIDFMITADKKAFVKFLKIMKETDGTFSDRWRNQTPDEQRRAIEEAYGVPLEKFEGRWKEYVRNGK